MTSRAATLRTLTFLGNVLVVATASVVSSRLRFGDTGELVWIHLIRRPRLAAAVYAVLAATLVVLVDRRAGRRRPLGARLAGVTRAALALGFMTMAVLYFLKLDDVSRKYLAIFFAVAWVGLFLVDTGVATLARALARYRPPLRRAVVVGHGPTAREFVERLTGDHPEFGYEVVGFVGPPDTSLNGQPRLGTLQDLGDVLIDQVVDEVLVYLPAAEWGRVDEIVRTAEVQGITVRVVLPTLGYTIGRGRIGEVDGVPVFTVAMTPDRMLALTVKRLIDIVGAVVGLMVLSPVLIGAAFAILVADGHPVFFTQLRAGLRGRPFRMVKFRTMTSDAEERKAELLEHNERTGPAFKLSDDPRITRVGRFLRRTSIDELPQLWNVLRGEMSLVGPRPPTFDEVPLYESPQWRRLSVKPGITGLWQVTARDDPSFERWVALDLEYIDSWSLGLDARILVSTLPAIVRMKGS